MSQRIPSVSPHSTSSTLGFCPHLVGVAILSMFFMVTSAPARANSCVDYSMYPRLVAEEPLAAPSPAIDVEDGLAYLGLISSGGSSAQLVVVDVTTPESPITLGAVSLPSHPGSVSYHQGHAYVTCRASGVVVVEVSDPQMPTIVTTIPTAADAFDVALDGATLVVADDSGFTILDVSDPGAPIVRLFHPEEGMRRVALAGDLLVTASTQLTVWDITVPEAPVFLDDSSPTGCACFEGLSCCGYRDLEIADNRLFVAQNNSSCQGIDCLNTHYSGSVAVWDLSDPGDLTSLGSLGVAAGNQSSNAVRDIEVFKGRLFATSGVSRIFITDVTGPISSSVPHELHTVSGVSGIAVFETGSIVHAIVAETMLSVYDVTNTQLPTFAGDATCTRRQGVAIFGDTMYTTEIPCPDGTWPAMVVQTYDATDPSSLQLVGSSAPAGYGFTGFQFGDLEIAGGDLYICGNSLARVELSGPGSIATTVETVRPRVSARDAEPLGDHLLVAPGHLGLVVLALTPGQPPTHETSLAGPAVKAISADGSRAVGVGTGGIHVFDVSNASSPVLAASIATGATPSWVALRGTLAAVGDPSGANEIRLFDVSNLNAPVELGSVPLPTSSSGGELVGNLLYAAGEDGMYAIEVSDPSSPALVGRVPTDATQSFRVASDAILCVEGGRLSVLPRACDALATAIELPVSSGRFGLNVFPNPSRTGSRIGFTLERPEFVRLQLFDARGARVRELAVERLAPGTHSRSWDGLDDSGRRVPSGVYFAKLRVGSRESTKKLVRIRE